MVVAAIAIWLATLISHGHHGGDGDAAHYLIITHSLAFDGDLDLANDYGPGTRLVFEGTLEPGSHARPHGSALRPVHDIGLPLIAAPLFRLTYSLADRLAASLSPEIMRRTKMTPSIVFRHFVSLQMIAIAMVLGLWLFALFNESCPGHRRTAAFLAVAVVPATPPDGVFFLHRAAGGRHCARSVRNREPPSAASSPRGVRGGRPRGVSGPDSTSETWVSRQHSASSRGAAGEPKDGCRKSRWQVES
jgi:hypothetical protein